MQRRTKIVATIGPASQDESTLRAMIQAGMDVARIGLAHGTIDDGLERLHRIRKVSADEGRRVGILVDLPGPKVRSASFGEDGVDMPTGHSVEIRTGTDASTSAVIEVDYESVAQLAGIVPGMQLLEVNGKSIITPPPT